MKRIAAFSLSVICSLLFVACGGSGNGGGSTPPPSMVPPASNAPFWAEWGGNPQHSGMVSVAGQGAVHQLADIVYDPFVPQMQAQSGGDLLAHYQAPIVDGNDVYIMTKTGTFTAGDWSTFIWNEARYTWINNVLTKIWTFQSDWKPPTNGASLSGWEPVFHPAEANNFIYVPGAAGTVYKVNKDTGNSTAHINPFTGIVIDAPNTFISSPLTADSQGNIYYNVIQLAPANLGDPWSANDVRGAWLVKITSADTATTITYATLVPSAPAGSATNCPGRFTNADPLPWPPSANATPNAVRCGSQRPGVNIAPAVAPDGTIYTVSKAHFDSRVSYLVAVNSNLSPKWVASMQNLLHDGCGVLVPIASLNNPSQAGSCRNGSTVGVDPTTNAFGSASVIDQGSSSPTVLPDGSILFGAMTNYNGARGHLFKFDSAGNFQGAFDFGWDTTPGVWQHNGTYSIVIKDNHYETGQYCNGADPICQPLPGGPYFITQLSPSLQIEWQFKSTNTQSCSRNASGQVTCVNDHPNGFEWCINMPAVDVNGNVFVNSEDGNLYVIPQGHSGVFSTSQSQLFLNLAVGAAYTPLSIGPDGKLYTQNDGHLFVVGN